MNLVVVYGLKTTDPAWFSQFYPAIRMSEECANRGITLRFLFPSALPSWLCEPDFTAQRASTKFLLRGEIPEPVRALAERTGRPCINSLQASRLVLDKLETARFLERNGWPTPRTVPFDPADGPGAIPFDFPFVVKPRRGSRGRDVRLIKGTENGIGFGPCPGKTEWIAQEYVAASFGRDIRVFFAGGTVIAAAERKGAPGDFRSNASTGGRMAVPGWWKEKNRWTDMTLEIARKTGLWYGTVDFLYLDGAESGGIPGEHALTVCEINGSPGFESLEKDCGFNIAGALLDALLLAQKTL